MPGRRLGRIRQALDADQALRPQAEGEPLAGRQVHLAVAVADDFAGDGGGPGVGVGCGGLPLLGFAGAVEKEAETLAAAQAARADGHGHEGHGRRRSFGQLGAGQRRLAARGQVANAFRPRSRRTSSTGMAKPTLEISALASLALATPITSPRSLTTGPPLLPGLTAASSWKSRSRLALDHAGPRGRWRP